MVWKVGDRIKQTTTSTGTGNLTLGTAVPGYRTYADAGISNNNTYYLIETLPGSTQWEVGEGYVTSGGVLQRNAVFSNSSNNTSFINFPAGTKNVSCVWPSYAYIGKGQDLVQIGSESDSDVVTGVVKSGGSMKYETNYFVDSTAPEYMRRIDKFRTNSHYYRKQDPADATFISNSTSYRIINQDDLNISGVNYLLSRHTVLPDANPAISDYEATIDHMIPWNAAAAALPSGSTWPTSGYIIQNGAFVHSTDSTGSYIGPYWRQSTTWNPIGVHALVAGAGVTLSNNTGVVTISASGPPPPPAPAWFTYADYSSAFPANLDLPTGWSSTYSGPADDIKVFGSPDSNPYGPPSPGGGAWANLGFASIAGYGWLISSPNWSTLSSPINLNASGVSNGFAACWIFGVQDDAAVSYFDVLGTFGNSTFTSAPFYSGFPLVGSAPRYGHAVCFIAGVNVTSSAVMPAGATLADSLYDSFWGTTILFIEYDSAAVSNIQSGAIPLYTLPSANPTRNFFWYNFS